MENNKRVARFFGILGCLLGAVCVVVSIATRTWLPVITFVAVLLGLLAISLLWAAVFVPLFIVISRICGKHGKPNHGLNRAGDFGSQSNSAHAHTQEDRRS